MNTMRCIDVVDLTDLSFAFSTIDSTHFCPQFHFNLAGIIPQAIYHCFNAVNSFPDREFLLRVSYLEVYNEQIKDLLGVDPVPIKIQHDPKLGTVISGKERVMCMWTQDCFVGPLVLNSSPTVTFNFCCCSQVSRSRSC